MMGGICSDFRATKVALVMGGTLLLRGMLVGLVAGLLCFGFLRVFGEPPVASAIAFESRGEEAAAAAKGAVYEPEPELVSRSTQAGIGLLTAVGVYGAAFGGLFALAFGFAYGRVGQAGPRSVSALLAAAGFIAIYLVPNLKYPSNPPSVGEAETIGMRTALYFSMIAFSLVAMVGAALLRRGLLRRLGDWNAALLAGVSYIVAVGVVMFVMPPINEVPEAFPAVVLWQFRMASFGAQAILWSVIGLGFGLLTDRAAKIRQPLRRAAAY